MLGYVAAFEAAAIVACYDAVARQVDGWLARPPHWWAGLKGFAPEKMAESSKKPPPPSRVKYECADAAWDDDCSS